MAGVTGKPAPPVTNRHDIVTGHLLKPLGRHARDQAANEIIKKLNGQRPADADGVDLAEAVARGRDRQPEGQAGKSC